MLFKLLKGDTSGIQNIVNVIENLSQTGQSVLEVKDASNQLANSSNITSGAVEIDDLVQYREILNDLTTEQQALVLSTSGLNAEQAQMVLTYSEGELATTALTQADAERLMVQSGLLTSTQALNAAEISALATKTGLSEVQLTQALRQAGMIVTTEGNVLATEALNKAELEQTLISAGCAESNAAETASLIANTAAKTANTAATSGAANVGNILIGVFSKLKAVVVAHPILAILTAITAGVAAFIMHEKKHQEEIKKISEETIGEYESTISRLTQNKKEFDELSKEYTDLSKGVNSLGQNVSLTTEEYDRYHDVANKLAEITPSLVKAWDDQGNAILNVKNNIDALTEAYKKETIEANNKVISNGKELLENSTNQLVENDLLAGEDWNYQDRINNLKGLLSKKNKVTVNDLEKFKTVSIDSNGIEQVQYGDLFSLLQNAGIDTSSIDWSKGADDYIKLLNNLSDKESAALDTYITKTEAALNESLADRKTLFKAYMQNKLLSDSDYTNIPSELEDVLYNITDTIDNSVFEGLDTEDKINDYVNNILTAFNSITDKQDLADLKLGINLSTQWNNDELPYSEYIAKVQEFVKLLETLFPDNKEIIESFKILFDIPNEEEIEGKQDVFVNRLGEKKVGANSKGYMNGVPPEIAEKLKSRGIKQAAEVADVWYDSLTKSQREFVDNVSDEDLAEAVKFNSTAQFDEWLKKLQDKAEVDVEAKVKASDAVESMADIKKAVGSLGDLYNQTVKKAIADGQATGFADPELINNVEAAFSKFSDTFKAEGNDQAANEINQALEEFEKTLVEFPGDADKAQGAIDNLITAYIDQTDAIQNLTEENKEWSKAQLKAMGITNAEEVVESRLSSTTKKLAEHFKTAASALQTLTSAQEGSTEYNDAMTSVGDRLGEMFSYTGENGETIVPNFDPTWIIQNLDLLKSAASGSTEAMYELQRAAAKKIAASVEINLPDQSAINGELNYINSLIDNFDISDIEVGTSLNDTPMIQGLNNLVNAGIITRDSMNAILSGIGVEPQITYEDVPITVAGDALTKINTTAGIQMQKGVKEAQRVGASVSGTVRVPKIDYQVTSKSVGAQYANPSKSTGGGDGGNGGSGDNGSDNTKEDELTKEEKETFDWIEVKIQRLEEAISRLNNRVSDTFNNWGKRNKSLGEQIAKITEEIKAQQIAATEYERNATNVTAGGEVLTDKQSSQLKKAQKAWTSKIQQDIENGKYLTKDKDGNEILDWNKLKKKLGKSANSYLKAAAQESFSVYLENKERAKNKQPGKKVNVIVGDGTKPKRDDYDSEKQYNYDLKQWKEAQKKWASGEYQKKIREGTMTGKDIEQIDNKYLKEAIKQETDLIQKAIDARDEEENKIRELKQANAEYFEFTTKQYEDLTTTIEKRVDLIQKKIDRTETKGYFVDKSYYKKQQALDKQELTKLIAERNEHIAQLNKQTALGEKNGGVDFGSEAWYEMYHQIMDDNAAVEEMRNSIAELDKQIKQLAWDKFDYLREKLDDITAEAEYLQEILSSEKMMDDRGFYNNRGWANAAMITVQYKEAQKGMNEVLKERAKITDAMRKNNKDEEDRWQDLTDKARDYAKAMMAAKDAMKSFVEESINQNLSKLKELMDEYKNAMSAAKD